MFNPLIKTVVHVTHSKSGPFAHCVLGMSGLEFDEKWRALIVIKFCMITQNLDQIEIALPRATYIARFHLPTTRSVKSEFFLCIWVIRARMTTTTHVHCTAWHCVTFLHKQNITII